MNRERAHEMNSGAGGPEDGKTLLVIDDDAVVRNLVTYAMEAHGYRVICAESGEEGLSLLEQGEVRIALVDVNLPGMSGMEVVSRFADTPSISFIMFSGDTSDTIRDQAIRAGAVDWLSKPFALKDLVSRIEQIREAHSD